jgi:hypothetical protein
MTKYKLEWDEEKRLANLKKHRLDFADAKQVYEHPNKVTVHDEYSDEERYRDLAEVNGKVRLLVYTMRGNTVRCISFRSTTPREQNFYYEQIANR